MSAEILTPDANLKSSKIRFQRRAQKKGKTHSFLLEVKRAYGPMFSLDDVAIDGATGHVTIVLSQSKKNTVCPYCGRKITKLQKHGKRTVTDIFMLNCREETDNPLDDFIVCDVQYENHTYRCEAEGCGKCFKIAPFLPTCADETAKTHYTARFVSFIKETLLDYRISNAGEAGETAPETALIRSLSTFIREKFAIDACFSTLYKLLARYPDTEANYLLEEKAEP